MYEHGIGVDQDPDTALLWYQKVADQGGYFGAFSDHRIAETRHWQSNWILQTDR
jgi:TPR repeat protein